MFERFLGQKPNKLEKELPNEAGEQTEEEIEQIIENVQNKTFNSSPESVSSTSYTTDKNLHPVKTAEDVEQEKEKVANPHGFSELK